MGCPQLPTDGLMGAQGPPSIPWERSCVGLLGASAHIQPRLRPSPRCAHRQARSSEPRGARGHGHAHARTHTHTHAHCLRAHARPARPGSSLTEALVL